MALPPKKKGIGVMIAIGRPKDAPQPPKGMKEAPGAEDETPDEPEQQGDDDGDETPTLYPESVHYHDDPRNCSNCTFYAGENCKLLKMQVSAEGGCCAHQGAEEGTDEGSGMGGDTDAGSGNGMMP